MWCLVNRKKWWKLCLFKFRLPFCQCSKSNLGIGVRRLTTAGLATLPKGNQELVVVKDNIGRPQVSLGWASPWNVIFISSILWNCWLGYIQGIRPVKFGYWFVDGAGDYVFGDLHVLQLQLSPLPVHPCCNKIRNGDILVSAYTGCRGKCPLIKRASSWRPQESSKAF